MKLEYSKIKKTTRLSMVKQINKVKAEIEVLRKKGRHAQYRYAKNWLKAHCEMMAK